MQLDFFLHQNENNAESQVNLDSRRDHFNNKCKTVYGWLMEGKELTVLQAAIDGVSSLPRRILDLRQKGITISDKWENGVKVYFMSLHDRVQNLLIK